MIHAAQIDKPLSLGLQEALRKTGRINVPLPASLDLSDSKTILHLNYEGSQFLGAGSYLVQGLLSHPGHPVSPYFWLSWRNQYLDPALNLIKGGLWNPAYHELRRFPSDDLDLKRARQFGLADDQRLKELHQEAEDRLLLLNQINIGGPSPIEQRLSALTKKIRERNK